MLLALGQRRIRNGKRKVAIPTATDLALDKLLLEGRAGKVLRPARSRACIEKLQTQYRVA